MIERLMYRSRYPKFAKRRKRLVWRMPKPIYSVDPDRVAQSWLFPIVSARKLRYLGRREVYPHFTDLSMAPIRRREKL